MSSIIDLIWYDQNLNSNKPLRGTVERAAGIEYDEMSKKIERYEKALRKIGGGIKNVSRNKTYGGTKFVSLKRMEMIEIAQAAIRTEDKDETKRG